MNSDSAPPGRFFAFCTDDSYSLLEIMSTDTRHSVVVRLTRRVLITVLVVCMLAAGLWVGYIRGGRFLCRIAIEQMAEMTNTRIATESVEFNPDGSVVIQGLSVGSLEGEGADERVFEAREVSGQFSLRSLLKFKPRLREILVNGFVFNARYDVDADRWNLSDLQIRIPEGGSGGLPLVNLRGGKLLYTKSSGDRVETVAAVPLEMRFELNRRTSRGCPFSVRTAGPSDGQGRSELEGYWRPGVVEVTSGFSATELPELEMDWTIHGLAAEFKYGKAKDYELKLSIVGLESSKSPDLDVLADAGPRSLGTSAYFTTLRKFFERYRPRGLVDLRIDSSGSLTEPDDITLSGKVVCRDVAIRYYKFDYPVDELTGTIGFTKNSVTLEGLRGKHKSVGLSFSGWTKDFGPNWKYDIHVTSEDMVLDEDMYRALNEGRRKMWDMLSPCGLTAVDYHVMRSGPTDKTRTLTLDLGGVQAKYRDFPYPLEDLTGRVIIAGASTRFEDVVSKRADRRIVINGDIETVGESEREYRIRVDVNNVPLDSTLLTSLPERHRELYRQFNALGLTDGTISVSRLRQERQRYIADLRFKDASLDCNDLPLSLKDVRAHAVFRPERIDVTELTGRHGETSLALSGLVRPSGDSDTRKYDLAFTLSNAEINDDLLDLLPDQARKSVKAMSPRGKVDLDIRLDNMDEASPTRYKIVVDCLGNSATLPQFPYPLKDATGKLIISPGKIEIDEIIAAPGDEVGIISTDSAIRLKGDVSLSAGSFEKAVLRVVAENIFFDDCLGQALPKGVRPFFDRLVPVGWFDLRLNRLEITKGDEGENDIEFGGSVDLERCRFKISGANTEVHDANLVADGKYEGKRGFADCDVKVKAGRVKVQGKALTNLEARLGYDSESMKWSMEDIVADCYGGKVLGTLDFNQPQDGPMDYVLKVGFTGLELKEFMADTRHASESGNGHSSGKMEGTLSVSAVAGDSSTRIGTCRLLITKMKVGKLSPMVNVLQVLKLSLPTEFAFDEMYTDAYIKGNGLIVKKLDLAGESLAFYGSGVMDLENRDVDLKLTGRGKRLATADPSLFASLTEEIGKAMVRIYVRGSFYDPIIETKPLPIITGPLDIFGKAVGGSKNYKP